jgi:1-acyl-sn-glycerol-3-phosphate acyltransferase
MVGLAMRRIGMVKVDRQRGTAIHSEVNSGVKEATNRGHSLIIFPEGTRSVDGNPAPFKKGAFRIAIANSLTIIPVTIQGTWEIWPPGQRTVTPGRVIRTVIHDPIPTNGLTLSDMDDVREQARKAIVTGWEKLKAEAGTGSNQS